MPQTQQAKLFFPYINIKFVCKVAWTTSFKSRWLEGLPSVSGRYGCPTQVESDSFYADCPRGSMDDELLNHYYIDTVIVTLYLNMHKTTELDPVTGKLNQGPVILKKVLDAGPGRILFVRTRIGT